MNRLMKMLLCLTITAIAAVVGYLLTDAPTVTAAPAAASGPVYLSPVAIVADKAGKTLYIAESTANRIDVLDVASEKVAKSIPMGAPPSGLYLSADEATLYVTAALSEGQLCVVDVKSGKITAKIPVGHTPMSPVVSPDGKIVYVANRFGRQSSGRSVGTISVVDLAAGKEIKTIVVAREPTALDVSHDGSTLLVANHLPATASDQDYAAAEVTILDMAGKADPVKISLPNGAMALRGLKISPDGKLAGVTHMLARFHLPTTQLERG
ncbi:MAG: hypothetical protein ISS69_01125, partial [Phycisphaerae bacterium]|nr:hypothetical protein [Phycisphaerae bacterium]